MIGRTSDFQTFSQVAANLSRLKARVDELNAQVASGSRVNKPSDDPAGTGSIIRSRSVLSALAQDERVVEFSQGFLAAQDGMLEDATNIITRAREIATQQASGLMSASDRDAAAAEAHVLLEALVAIGNSDLAGRRLFSAGEEAAGTAPFVDPNDAAFDPSNPYVGSTNPLQVNVGTGQTVRITTTGSSIFNSGIAALDDLETRLRADTSPGSTLTLLEGAAADISTERADIGSRALRLEQRGGQITQQDVVANEVISTTKGADSVSLTLDLLEVQTQLNVAAAASQIILDASLVNVLDI